jgi:hypothetical protein
MASMFHAPLAASEFIEFTTINQRVRHPFWRPGSGLHWHIQGLLRVKERRERMPDQDVFLGLLLHQKRTPGALCVVRPRLRLTYVDAERAARTAYPPTVALIHPRPPHRQQVFFLNPPC